MWIPARNTFTCRKRINTYCNGYACTILSIINVRFKHITMKYLNVAEKNDAAKNIAMHLSRGASHRREGLSKYNKIYEFNAEVFGQNSRMVMTSVSGHLLELDFVSTFKNWNSCNPVSLFGAQVIKMCPKNFLKIQETLANEVRSCDGLIIWTDCDREGENIGFEIIRVCTEKKNNLLIYRAKFSEITSASVERALRSLEQPNRNISDAVDVRQELDLRIGAAFTRLQTMRLSKVFPSQLQNSVVSYGSCQFPTLGFVVERYRAIENFVAELYWKITVKHTIGNLSVNFTWERGRLFDKHACQVLFNIVSENPMAKVININTHQKSKWRPLPLDTVELEKSASRKLKINAKETMNLAEKLYTKGFISYPRTETNQFPKEMNLRSLVEMQTADNNWGTFAQSILDDGGPTPRQGTKTDMAHPPIHPTKYTNTLSDKESLLYEFIVRSFLACCSKDAQGQETTVTIDVAKEIFTANGLLITARNYLDVYPYDKWSSKEIHRYQMNQSFTASPSMVEGTTSPPNLLTEADLIALMEKHGIGTDATHAEHIEKIKSREYVHLANGVHFVPTLLGMGLVEGYDSMGLHMSRPDLRAQLEADLKAISEGRKQPQDVLADQIEKYKNAFIILMEEGIKLDSALAVRFNVQPGAYNPSVEVLPVSMPPALKCPKCGADMMIRQKKDNDYYVGCSSFPSCRNAVWLPSFVKTAQVLPEKCPICGPNYHKIKFEWKNNTVNHLFPSPYIACFGGCDVTLLEHLKVDHSSIRTISNSSTGQSTIISSSRSSNTTNNSATNGNAWPLNNYNSFTSSNILPVYRPRAQNTNTVPSSSNSRNNVPWSRPTSNRGMHNSGRVSNVSSRGQGRGSGSGSRGPRRCGLCRQEGHTRPNCPQRAPTPP